MAAWKRSLLVGSATVLVVAGLAFVLLMFGRGSAGRQEYDGLPSMSVDFERIYLPGRLARTFVPAAIDWGVERRRRTFSYTLSDSDRWR